MLTSLRVTGFVVVLGLVFGLAWLAGGVLTPAAESNPLPPPSGQSIPAGAMPGMP